MLLCYFLGMANVYIHLIAQMLLCAPQKAQVILEPLQVHHQSCSPLMRYRQLG